MGKNLQEIQSRYFEFYIHSAFFFLFSWSVPSKGTKIVGLYFHPRQNMNCGQEEGKAECSWWMVLSVRTAATQNLEKENRIKCLEQVWKGLISEAVMCCLSWMPGTGLVGCQRAQGLARKEASLVPKLKLSSQAN